MLEGIGRIVVEADDESGQQIDAMAVDRPHCGQHVAAEILRLACLLQTRRVGGIRYR